MDTKGPDPSYRKISIIAAMGENGVIGRDNSLPWRLPADMAHFRRLTVGKPVIMGRRTWRSLERPLPDRHNIVVTGSRDFEPEGCDVAHSIEEALEAAGKVPEVMIIGGAEIYRQFLPLADRMYLTLVQGSFEGDTFFPGYDVEGWRETERGDHLADERNPHDYSFVTLDRRTDL